MDGTDPVRLRAVSALLADHRVDRVGVLGRTPPKAWGERTVPITTAAGWDIVVGVSPPAGSIDVTVGEGGAVSWAGPTGLARSLGERLGPGAILAGTTPGDPLPSGRRFGFPAPIGWLHGVDTDGIHHCPTRGSLAAVMAQREERTVVVLDDRDFLDGAALAAGVLLAAEGHRGPVWESAETFVQLTGDLGLVLADQVA
ncbi:MAG TPA: hypothetical protein VLB67_15120 [Acidimicrobiia bacterium]|nr:hypothetical protein [Acidimicrobiia bacterium]